MAPGAAQPAAPVKAAKALAAGSFCYACAIATAPSPCPCPACPPIAFANPSAWPWPVACCWRRWGRARAWCGRYGRGHSATEQAQQHFVDERGGLQRRMARRRTRHAGGNAAQIGIDERQQVIECGGIAVAPTLQLLGDAAFGLSPHSAKAACRRWRWQAPRWPQWRAVGSIASRGHWRMRA